MLDLSHLPAVDLGTLHCLNSLRLYDAPIAIPLEDSEIPIQFQLGKPPVGVPAGGLIEVVCFTEIGVVSFTVPFALVDVLSNLLLPGWSEEKPDKLLIEWRTVYAMEQFMLASQFAGMQCHVMYVERPDEFAKGPDTLAFEVKVGNETFEIVMAMGQGQSEPLSKYLAPHLVPTKDLGSIVVELNGLTLGPQLRVEEIRNLTVGDIVILSGCAGGSFPLTIKADDATAWSGMCDANGNFTVEQKGN